VASTGSAYSKAFKTLPKLTFGKVYVVQAIGAFTARGHSFKSLILFFSTRTGNLVAQLDSIDVKNLRKLGAVVKL